MPAEVVTALKALFTSSDPEFRLVLPVDSRCLVGKTLNYRLGPWSGGLCCLALGKFQGSPPMSMINIYHRLQATAKPNQGSGRFMEVHPLRAPSSDFCNLQSLAPIVIVKKSWMEENFTRYSKFQVPSSNVSAVSGLSIRDLVTKNMMDTATSD